MITIGEQKTGKAIKRSLPMLFEVMKPKRTAPGSQAERSGGVKASAYILLLALGMGSCGPENATPVLSGKDDHYSAGFVYTITRDSCEYIIFDGGYAGGIVHKQNCKFCKNGAKTNP